MSSVNFGRVMFAGTHGRHARRGTVTRAQSYGVSGVYARVEWDDGKVSSHWSEELTAAR